MKKGAELAQEHKCLFCHGADFAGGQQVPRIAGQSEDYPADDPAWLQVGPAGRWPATPRTPRYSSAATPFANSL